MARPKSVYTARKQHIDRTKDETETFSELSVKVEDIETAILLLDSTEELVLIPVFKHIVDYAKKREENLENVKSKNVFQILLRKQFFVENDSSIVRRFALYLTTLIIETLDPMKDFEPAEAERILDLCIRFYIMEGDDFCLEYLSVIINKWFDDPQVARLVLDNAPYLSSFFEIISKTENPDTLLHSFESMHKMLLVQNTEEMQKFISVAPFPIERVICDITNEFVEIRSAALKILKCLVVDVGEDSAFPTSNRRIQTLGQLTKLLAEHAMSEQGWEIMDVFATALSNELMTQLFFEQNLFDLVVQNMVASKYPFETNCSILSVFAEAARYPKYLKRMQQSNVLELFIECLLQSEHMVGTHVPLGLNRFLKMPSAAHIIVASYTEGFVGKLLSIMQSETMLIKTREASGELMLNMLQLSFHRTAEELLNLEIDEALTMIIEQGLYKLSIDYILTLLVIIETLARNNEYRTTLGESKALTRSLALLLRNSFATAILVSSIFRCLCTLVDEENVQSVLLQNYIGPSVKRGLKSISNLVKASVTNFIMQTTRFQEYVTEFIESGALEVLIMNQKHAFCVPTWNPAIESILSKCPSLKFCIRNHLSFTDTTAGNDFYVSKQNFEDFRTFLNILKEEVSPLHPILVVTFERKKNPAEHVVEVPPECFDPAERPALAWCYCRKPGDEFVPAYLDDVNAELEHYSLVRNPEKMQRSIDFENVARRAKVIAAVVARVMSSGLKPLDLNGTEDCSTHFVKCHLKDLTRQLHCNFIPIGMVRSGCQFERAILFKCLADQIGLPCTLQRSVDGKLLFNEVPLPLEIEEDEHCDKKTLTYMPWRMLRPTHIVDLAFNVGELYPVQSRQALQYLRLF